MDETFHIQWHITNSCNLRCTHCYQENFTSEKDISFKFLKEIFTNVENFLKEKNKKLVLDLTGGEIFLYKDWKKIIELVFSSEIVNKIGIITNGFFLNNSTIEFLKSFPDIEIKISTEGIEKEIYEFYRGKGAYEKFIEVIERLKITNFNKTLMFTITESNNDQVEKIFDFCKEYKFSKFIIERFIPLGNSKEMKEDIVKIDTWCKIIKILFENCDLEFNIHDVLPYRGFMVEMKNEGNFLYGAFCIVGRDGIAIMPEGDVFPCRRFPLKIGNLLQQKLSDIWENSPVLNLSKDKKNLKGICKGCIIDDCFGCRALAYSLKNDFLEEDILCFFNWKGGKNVNGTK